MLNNPQTKIPIIAIYDALRTLLLSDNPELLLVFLNEARRQGYKLTLNGKPINYSFCWPPLNLEQVNKKLNKYTRSFQDPILN